MPIKRVDTTAFTMLVYERKNGHDFEQLHKDVDSLCQDAAIKKDIVLDFCSLPVALAPEMSLIEALLKSLGGTSRKLRLLPCVNMFKKLKLLNIDDSPNLVVYKDRQSFLTEYAGSRLSH
jgi:hypothetical protein